MGIKKKYNLDMNPGGVPLVIHMSQYDSDFTLGFDLYSSDGDLDVSTATTAVIRGAKTDGNIYTEEVTLSGDAVTVKGDKQLTAAAGRNVYEITFYDKNEKEISSQNFILDVEPSALSGGTSGSASKILEVQVTMIKQKAEEAKQSADAAAKSATAASNSAAAAANSATAAAGSATKAAGSAADSQKSATASAGSASSASGSAAAAAKSADAAAQNAKDAAASATNLSSYTDKAAKSATDAAASAKDADDSAKAAAASAALAESRSGGGLIPMGTVAFDDLPAEADTGAMYNISDDFTTTENFLEGAGKQYAAGSNVYRTASGKWDVLGGGSTVTGVKGDAEDAYRTGDVSLSPADIGALGKTEKAASAAAADKLASGDVGDKATPVYFKDGVPIPCTDIKGGGTTIVQAPDFSTATTTFKYTGEAQGPSVDYDSENITISGATATQPGAYTMTFSLKDKASMMWNDLTTADKTLSYTIGESTVDIPTATGDSFTYNGSAQGPKITGLESAYVDVTNATATDAGSYTLTFSLKNATVMKWSDGTKENKTYTYTIAKAEGTLTLSSANVGLSANNKSATVNVTAVTDGATISAKSNDTSVATVSVSGTAITITAPGAVAGTATITVTASETTNYKTATKTITATATFAKEYVMWHILESNYGAQWSRDSSSAGFTDPVPYVKGATAYSSPFDNIMPWAGMKRVTRPWGEAVAIPKFWYQCGSYGAGGNPTAEIHITSEDPHVDRHEYDGWNVSPAHMDRGDGKGERDIVYVGRYHCASDYKSKSGEKPITNITRATAREEIHKLGENCWQMDYATRFTIWLLYLVEYANWNSQKCIGYGCGNKSSTEAMGYTDDMPYHTGTTLSSRTSYGCGTQYRYIEGLWDNVFDWLDGCYYNSDGLNIILNPNNFSDSSGGVAAGVPSSGYPSDLNFRMPNGLFPMFYPKGSSGSDSKGSCDFWSFGTSNPCLYAGGDYRQHTSRGLFYVNCYGASGTVEDVGCRLLELP